MENYRAKGGKYSYFLKDLTLNLFSIEYIAYSKMSEIIHLFTGIEIDSRRIFDIVEDNFDSFANKRINQIKKELKELGIQPGEAVHYDEEFVRQDRVCATVNCLFTLFKSVKSLISILVMVGFSLPKLLAE